MDGGIPRMCGPIFWSTLSKQEIHIPLPYKKKKKKKKKYIYIYIYIYNTQQSNSGFYQFENFVFCELVGYWLHMNCSLPV